jgi:hypothetical protein
MKRTVWMLAAFAAGMIGTAAATRAGADIQPLPHWVFKPGTCLIVAGGGGTEIVREVQGAWVRTERAGVRPQDAPEQWRNLAAVQWIERRPEEACRQ